MGNEKEPENSEPQKEKPEDKGDKKESKKKNSEPESEKKPEEKARKPEEETEKLFQVYAEVQEKTNEELQKMTKLLEELLPNVSDRPTQEKIADALSRSASAAEESNRYNFEYLMESRSELPQELRVPTKERLAKDLGKESKDLTMDEIRTHVEAWFEQRLRQLESFDQTFEEHSWLYSPLEVAATYYEYQSDTKLLGEELRRKLEARRVRQRMVRVWDLGNPEAIWQESARLTLPMFKELFTYESPNGEKLVEREFQEYEKKGQELLALRQKADETKADEDKSAAKKKEKEILDYFRHGGKDTDGELVDKKIAELESKPLKTSDDNEELDRLHELFWARRFTGGLWRITQRSAFYDIQFINGGGDFFAARLLNFVKRLEEDALSKKTKGIWNPDQGKFKGQPFDLEYRDFFTNLMGSLKVQDGPNKDQIDHEAVAKYKIGKIETKNVLGETPSKDKGSIDVVGSLAEANLSNREFWQELESKYGVAENTYNLQMYGFNVADATRKALLGASAFFHSPELISFLELGKTFENITAKKEYIETERKGILRRRERVEVAGRQRKWQELLERVLEWGKTKKAGEVLEQWKVFPSAEKFIWIEKADDEEMITREQSDLLMSRYLPLGIPFINARSQARTRALISLVIGPWRYGPMRSVLIGGWIFNYIKSGLKYVFQE